MNIERLFYFGLVLIFIGIFLIIISSFSLKEKTKIAVGGFIGFIPFGFANDKKMLYLLLGFMFLVFIVWIFIFKAVGRC